MTKPLQYTFVVSSLSPVPSIFTYFHYFSIFHPYNICHLLIYLLLLYIFYSSLFPRIHYASSAMHSNIPTFIVVNKHCLSAGNLSIPLFMDSHLTCLTLYHHLALNHMHPIYYPYLMYLIYRHGFLHPLQILFKLVPHIYLQFFFLSNSFAL